MASPTGPQSWSSYLSSFVPNWLSSTQANKPTGNAGITARSADTMSSAAPKEPWSFMKPFIGFYNLGKFLLSLPGRFLSWLTTPKSSAVIKPEEKKEYKTETKTTTPQKTPPPSPKGSDKGGDLPAPHTAGTGVATSSTLASSIVPPTPSETGTGPAIVTTSVGSTTSETGMPKSNSTPELSSLTAGNTTSSTTSSSSSSVKKPVGLRAIPGLGTLINFVSPKPSEENTAPGTSSSSSTAASSVTSTEEPKTPPKTGQREEETVPAEMTDSVDETPALTPNGGKKPGDNKQVGDSKATNKNNNKSKKQNNNKSGGSKKKK